MVAGGGTQLGPQQLLLAIVHRRVRSPLPVYILLDQLPTTGEEIWQAACHFARSVPFANIGLVLICLGRSVAGLAAACGLPAAHPPPPPAPAAHRGAGGSGKRRGGSAAAPSSAAWRGASAAGGWGGVPPSGPRLWRPQCTGCCLWRGAGSARAGTAAAAAAAARSAALSPGSHQPWTAACSRSGSSCSPADGPAAAAAGQPAAIHRCARSCCAGRRQPAAAASTAAVAL